MELTYLVEKISSGIAELAQCLESGERIPALGLRRAARLPALAALCARFSRPTILLTDRADRALALFDELELWAPEAARALLPEPTPLFYENAPWGENTRRERIAALTRLAMYHIPGSPAPEKPPLLIAPARAVMARTLPRRDFLKAARSLRPGQQISPEELARALVALGYEPSHIVIATGQFARRGGLLDVWPHSDPQPTRIEFFGDEVDTLRAFHPASQRTAGTRPRLFIPPAREFLAPPSAANNPEAGFSEFHLPLLHPEPATFLDYLPRQALVLVDNLQALQDTVAEVEEQAHGLRRDYIKDGSLPADYPLPYLTWSELLDSLLRHSLLELGPPAAIDSEEQAAAPALVEAPGEGCSGETGLAFASRFSAEPRFGGRVKPFMEQLLEIASASQQAVVVSRQVSRLQELWNELRLHQEEPAVGKGPALREPTFIQGSLGEGWVFQAPGGEPLHLFTDGEIFGWRRPEPRQRARPTAEAPEAAYADLVAGDFVVHSDHGIGCYVGLVNRTIDGIEREYLCIEYAEQAQLYVPVHQADRVTRYVGPDGRTPALSRLGGNEWRSTRAYVKEAVAEVAEELLELYARRNVIQGYAFSPDSHWQQELEASFPYVETDDQMRVLAEVKADMERERPMDRLICGDVGYGKTEVALRAAFKAVMDGKQVAILVPTTVLAQQHYTTFNQRLAAFPVEVEMLSRFRTPQQQREIIDRLANGSVDIVIGTHRLISSDVAFKNLGLLIIDEEQRFGVSHKEALKRMRTEVDVLTLTATPIPRTLYMTLTGVRDISTINTPPEERLPIITHVGPYSPKLVRQAILRELERGGQVFFVHNRVQTIGAMRNHLAQMVPEARVAVAHGQMAETELSERMKAFTRGDVDVLLSTSIIESGLDIPNANTLIVDRADTFGLAQLYQLRGRVGRGAQRAYAYFFRHARRPPTLDGRQRLETISENTQLGAGFSIAMRDLEIRGAGELLGTRQSGHIAAVGFHLYTRLLADAIRRMSGRGELPAVSGPLRLPGSEGTAFGALALPVNVDLPLAASIPASYVLDKNMRLRLYRRLADTRSLDEVNALAEEFKDRFGELPEAVENLLYQLRLKLLAEKAGLTSISAENGQIVLRFPEGEPPFSAAEVGPHARLGKTAVWLPYRNLSDWQAEVLALLHRLAESSERSGLPTG
jgi:transcription-repair coupling factor (superfamily II helicase)